MHGDYGDILERIDEPPSWFDENGAPRYGAFSPRRVASAYAHEAALMEISCQDCGHVFHVAVTETSADVNFSLSDCIRLGGIDYGDPPAIGCCSGGHCAQSIPHGILEYWSKDFDVSWEWVRDPTFEGEFSGSFSSPCDVVPEALAAMAAGAARIRVDCTSRRNRHDIVGRLTAELLRRGRVIVACPDNREYVDRRTFESRIPAHSVGSLRDHCDVALARFGELREADLRGFATLIALPGSGQFGHSGSQNLDAQIAAFAANGISCVELALAQSRPVIGRPDVVIDAGRVIPLEQ